jgi:hypothetical protein
MLQTSALDDYGAGPNLLIYQDDSLASAHAAEQLVSAGSMTAATPFDWTPGRSHAIPGSRERHGRRYSGQAI